MRAAKRAAEQSAGALAVHPEVSGPRGPSYRLPGEADPLRGGSGAAARERLGSLRPLTVT
ncbi:hypothetical protein GCM10010279_16420 [Streptomyces mutabilis]|nr:hypothetical protein GCM10010279_16420 [Streptomyces mutabilis]